MKNILTGSIILAGGVGTRLWPLSREQFPKQFLKLNGASFFQDTYTRALRISSPEEIVVVTNENFRYHVKNQVEELGYSIDDSRILLESEGKNTLPAITWGIRVLYDIFGDIPVAVFPSDHILDEKAMDIIKNSAPLAKKNLVVFGIKPTAPLTGYGYIKPGEALDGGFAVKEFKEKPCPEKAKEYMDSGYLWNSGMFLFSPEVFFEELKKYLPNMYDEFERPHPDYSGVESISIDYGLLEVSDRVAVVPLSLRWNDLGSFRALYENLGKDDKGNAGDAEFVGSENNFVYLKDKKVAVLGMTNTAIIDSGDALLVCDLDNTESVKELVGIYASRGDDITKYHLTVHRPWGSYTILESKKFFKIKRVTVSPMKSLSLQLHHHRSEHWVVVSGTAEVQLGDKVMNFSRGQSTFVGEGVVHRLGNPGKIPLEVIEIQIGEYLKEDDIVRFDDDFGRV
ncbi:mannose-1-phosphate guanylyltransferase/mannose-6-phosphate isomerase [Methanolacinia petrolearia]|uniref:mannose-1-phosphate guanylyltransferase/mannose-6-phosphate isomerase n=1 Tax=Methanolacinia petrolearia TaxID=54120 RepID=UPI003BAA1A79